MESVEDYVGEYIEPEEDYVQETVESQEQENNENVQFTPINSQRLSIVNVASSDALTYFDLEIER